MPRRFNKKKKLHVKKGDDVKILAGKDIGETGRVLMVYPDKDGGGRWVRYAKASGEILDK